MEYGLIGEKLCHSFSKEIYTDYFGLDYDLKELRKCEVAPFLKTADFKAVNVTIPYKETVIPHLDFLSDTAKKTGAVNVILNENGVLKGYNTDFSGMKLMIEKSGVGLCGKKVLILGDGATSKTALAVANELNCKSAIRVSRKGTPDTVSYAQATKLKDIQILINTTPVGMYPNTTEQPIDIDCFPHLESVFDAVYNPICTALVTKAKAKKITACGGLYMLVSQAIFSARLFKNTSFPDSKFDQIYNDILKQKRNIVLIGMPSCGKTTVGKILAEKTGREFIDTDSQITKKYGEIKDIISTLGEDKFRDFESEIIAEVSSKNGKVIATGGGAVLRHGNMDLLKQNGKIYFLDRPFEELVATPDRPLSSDSESLKKIYTERYSLYLKYCDEIIKLNTTAEDAVRRITENENLGN